MRCSLVHTDIKKHQGLKDEWDKFKPKIKLTFWGARVSEQIEEILEDWQNFHVTKKWLRKLLLSNTEATSPKIKVTLQNHEKRKKKKMGGGKGVEGEVKCGRWCKGRFWNWTQTLSAAVEKTSLLTWNIKWEWITESIWETFNYKYPCTKLLDALQRNKMEQLRYPGTRSINAFKP